MERAAAVEAVRAYAAAEKRAPRGPRIGRFGLEAPVALHEDRALSRILAKSADRDLSDPVGVAVDLVALWIGHELDAVGAQKKLRFGDCRGHGELGGHGASFSSRLIASQMSA